MVIAIIIGIAVIFFLVRYLNNTKSSQSIQPVDNEVIRLLNIAITKIGPRYAGGISLYISPNSMECSFKEYNETYSETFRAVITQQDVSAWMDYDFVLRFFNLTAEEANYLRRSGHEANRCWRITLNRRINSSTIAEARALARNHGAEVNVQIRQSNDATLSLLCSPLN